MIFAALALMVCAFAFAPMGFAAEGAEAAGGEVSTGGGLRAMGLAIGAGIAIAGAGLGTGRAQSGVGAGGTGALAEKPELFGNVLILFAIPETIVVFGFVIAIMLVNAI
jgi:V/A-type H+-transporting ATPase subunit K